MPVGRGTRPRCDSEVVPVKWSKASDRVVLVPPLHGVALDLEVEESHSELAQKVMIPWVRELAIRGG